MALGDARTLGRVNVGRYAYKNLGTWGQHIFLFLFSFKLKKDNLSLKVFSAVARTVGGFYSAIPCKKVSLARAPLGRTSLSAVLQ